MKFEVTFCYISNFNVSFFIHLVMHHFTILNQECSVVSIVTPGVMHVYEATTQSKKAINIP